MHIRKHEWRFGVVFLTLLLCLGIFVIKLIRLQVFNAGYLSSEADKQHHHLIDLEPVRGSIFDRNGRPLAFNVSVYSLFANPNHMSAQDKQRAVEELPAILDVDISFLKKRLGRQKYFVWLKRKLPLELYNQIKALKIKGLDFRKESKRFYPDGSLAAHVIGFAGMDNRGLEGLELSYDKYLKGAPGQMHVLRDARQRSLMMESDVVLPRDGFHLNLTIDETIQYIAEQALQEAFTKHNAKGATIIVMHVPTGEVLALANLPTYDLSQFSKSTISSRTNRAVSYVYEPGSVFKMVTAVAALEEEKFVEEDRIFCENGEYRISRHVLHDHRPHGDLSFSEVFAVSSNIGVTKIAQELGATTIYKYADRFRFGHLTGIELSGEVDGWLKHPARWSKTTIGAIPMGQEVTVTSMQLIGAVAALANKGVYMKPTVLKSITNRDGELIKNFPPQVVDRVMSEDTARRVGQILKMVVDEGTGTRAQIEGISVAGKTGTAQKVVDGKYSHSKFYATFLGFAPVENPVLAAVVVFDEPHPSYFGGTVAAPVFKTVIERSLKYLEMAE